MEPLDQDETLLWSAGAAEACVRCVMVACCSGAELQLRVGREVRLRELYPDHQSLRARADELRSLWERDG